MSINGPTVSFRCSQKISLDFLLRKSAEYSNTAMSCRPPSETLVKVAKYEKSLGSAEVCFVDSSGDAAIREVRTFEVSSGIGSSGLLEWVRSGRKGLKGSGCSEIALESPGIPIKSSVRFYFSI